MLEVKDHKGLVRDPNTGAVLNINKNEAEKARERKALKKLKQQEDDRLKEKVDQLSTDINDLKSMLTQLIENRNGI